MRRDSQCRSGALAVLAALALLSTPPAGAEAVDWIGGDGAWESPANWSTGALPSDEDFVTIPGAVEVTSSAGTNTAEELFTDARIDVLSGLLKVVGTVDSSAVLNLVGGARLESGRILLLRGGSLSMRDPGTEALVVEGVFNGYEVDLDGMVTLAAESFDNFATWEMRNQSQAVANSMINHDAGLLSVNDAATLLTINGNLTNKGSFAVDTGSNAMIDTIDNAPGGDITVTGAAALAGDSVVSEGQITIAGAGSRWTAGMVSIDGGSVTVDGGEAELDATDNRASLMLDDGVFNGTDFSNASGAQTSLSGASTMTLSGLFLNQGDLDAGPASALLTERFQQLAGETQLAGSVLGATSPFGADIAGGVLRGHGTIDGILRTTAAGSLSPGSDIDATASFDITGSLDLGGEFLVDLAGTDLDAFDRLLVATDAHLDGTLVVSLTGGFNPQAGDFFDIVLATTVTGDFASVILPVLDPGLAFLAYNGGDRYRLEVAQVPLPGAAVLLLLPLLRLARGVRGVATRERDAAG